MATTNYASVDEYLAARPDETRDILERVRATIRKAIPKAQEMISYQIPTYKIDGAPVIYFAGWKAHLSVYPATRTMLAAFRDDLEPYTIAKGTVRFELSQPVPLRLIARIAKHRANEVTANARDKAATPNSARARQTSRARGTK